MAFGSRKASDPSRAQAARLAVDEQTTARAQGGGVRASGPSRPARVSYGLPALNTNARTLPTPPARPDAASPREHQTSGRPIPVRRHEAALVQFRREMDSLHPIAALERGQPTAPLALSQMRSVDGFLDAVDRFFGTGSDGRALALKLLGAIPPGAAGEAAYLAPLVVLTALHAAGAPDARTAAAMLADLKDPALSTPEKFRLERALAATVPGTEALAHLHGLQQRPAQVQLLREGLQLCADLERKGFDLAGHGSIDSVVQALQSDARARMDHDIGHADDTPLQLLAKAARHVNLHAQAAARGEATPAGPHSDRAAYVAWKQGGFVESGQGSDFDRAIGRMHKFMSYVERADHGPRTAGQLARDAASYLGRAVGVGKSPLSMTRHGTLGGDLDRADVEAARQRAALDAALTQAVDHLVGELSVLPARQADAREGHPRLARAAVLDLWRETGDTGHAVAAVQARAVQLLARAGAEGQVPDEQALARSLRRFTRPLRDADAAEPAVRAGMRTLEALAQARARGGAGLRQPQQRQDLRKLLAELRATGRVGADAVPLFKLSDLKALLRGQPRSGPTAEDARRVMKAMTQDKGVLFATFADGASGGVGGVASAIWLAGGLGGAPLVYPVFGAEGDKSAAVAVGNYSSGGRLVVGSERVRSARVGIGAGWASPPLADRLLTASAVAQATASHGSSRMEGLVISARNDIPGWQGKLPEVIDFLFDQARLQPGDSTAPKAQDAAELWGRYAQRFGDDPHLGVSWVADRARATAVSVSAGAVARVRTGAGTAIGPGVSIGKGAGGSRLERTVNAGGADVPIASRRRVGSVTLSASLVQSTPVASALPGPQMEAWGLGSPLAGFSAEWAGGHNVVARLGRNRDGTLSPKLCTRDIMFTDAPSLIAQVNRHRAGWERALVEGDASGHTGPGEARARLNGFVQQAASVDSPIALYGEMVELSAAAAARINGLEAQLATILGEGDARAGARALSADERRESHALQNEVQRLLKDESSWVPRALWAAETNARGSTTGLNLGLKLVNQEQAEALHLTALLAATTPRPA